MISEKSSNQNERRNFFSELRDKGLEKASGLFLDRFDFLKQNHIATSNQVPEINQGNYTEIIKTLEPMNYLGDSFGGAVRAFCVFDFPTINQEKKLIVFAHGKRVDLPEGTLDLVAKEQVEASTAGISTVELIIDKKNKDSTVRLNSQSLFNRRLHRLNADFPCDEIQAMCATFWDTVLFVSKNLKTQELSLIELDPFRLSAIEYPELDTNLLHGLDLELNSESFIELNGIYRTARKMHHKRIDANKDLLKSLQMHGTNDPDTRSGQIAQVDPNQSIPRKLVLEQNQIRYICENKDDRAIFSVGY